MKKILLLSLIVLSISIKAHTQKKTVVYYDAKFIRDSCLNSLNKFKGIDNLTKVLKSYYPSITSDDAVIRSLLEPNPFLSPFLPSGGIAQGLLSGTFAGLSASSLGGLDVTKYANAIADILIERAKQELTVAFFDRFKKFADDNPEFQILFPNTTDKLKKLLSYSYPQWLPALRKDFFDDLKQITYHLDDVLDLPRYQRLLQDFPEVKVAIRSVRLVHELETGASNAADIINEFAEFKEWEENIANTRMRSVGSCLKISKLFSESIRSNDTTKNEVWVPAKEVKTLFYDSVLFKIYMGLIFQQSINDSIHYISANGETDILFSEILRKNKDNLFLFRNKLKEFFDLAANVNTAFKEFKKKIDDDEKPTDEDIYNYVSVSIDVIDFGFSIVNIFHEKPIADKYLAIVRKGNNLYKSIYTKQYTQAVSDALDVFSIINELIEPNVRRNSSIDKDSLVTLAPPALKDAVKEIASTKSLSTTITVASDFIIDTLNNGAALNINIKHLAVHRALERLTDFINKVKPYALFMANMVEAKDEKEVKAALENVILPVGSSSVKKHTLCNISVQTYLGAFWSYSNKNNINSSWSDRFGVIAPIGISWTPGFASLGKGGSFSLFGSLFDLGAIVDYRLKKEPDPTSLNPNATITKKDYEVKLGQIFSPGGYLVYGFAWNLPLSLGFGWQYGPGFSKINSNGDPIVNNPSWRGNFFLAVDIPFFNIKNKVKN